MKMWNFYLKILYSPQYDTFYHYHTYSYLPGMISYKIVVNMKNPVQRICYLT